MSHDDTLIAQLQSIVGEAHVRTDDSSLQSYGCDWTKVYDPAPRCIVLPKTTEEVQAIVKLANELEVAIVPSGGRTGLSAAAVAANGEVVVAFDRMNQILDFNEADRCVKCQPGVVTEQLQQFAEDNNLYYPVDFASAGSSQLGGNIGTNAGGIKVIRYGMTRDWVAGLTVVTGKGDLIRCNKGLVKNATGYDFRHLFVGSEGTLGLVVEADMRLARTPKDLTVLVLGVPEFSAMMSVLAAFQSRIDLTAFEFFSEKSTALVTAHGDVQRPFETETPYYALLEFEAISEQITESAMEIFEHCVEQEWVLDGVMSQSQSQAAALWRLREDISETISVYTPYKNDISVVVSKVPDFLKDIDDIVTREYPDFDIIWFGHIGDGNLHLNILKPQDMPKEEFFDHCKQVNTWVFETVKKYDGSVSAEHGVGMTKKDYLHYTRDENELEYMRAMKQVFDPKGIMNPGKVFDLA